jgi:hypothetical protein
VSLKDLVIKVDLFKVADGARHSGGVEQLDSCDAFIAASSAVRMAANTRGWHAGDAGVSQVSGKTLEEAGTASTPERSVP